MSVIEAENAGMYSVSVVIPLYNNEDTIVDALESVRKQTLLHNIIQVIVVDDGSVDSSYEVVERYSSVSNLPVELFRQDNKGAAGARNTGLKHAKGEWVAFLDADDEWLPNRIERQIEILKENKEIDFLGAGYNDLPLRILWKKITTLYKASVYDLVIKYFPCTPSIIMRRSIFEEIGGFNEEWRYAEDGEYYTRICLKYGYYYLPEHLVDIGHGKRTFGEKGLSGNLQGMYIGNINIIKSLKQEGVLSNIHYCLLRIFYYLKYIRRIIITKIL